MNAAKIHRLSERIRHIARQEDKLAEIAKDVDGLEVLARVNAEAQRATGDAVAAIAAALDAGLDTQREHGERLEAIEGGLLEVLAIVRAEQTARKQAAADARASGAALEAQLAPVAADAAEMRRYIADASRKAGNAGATKAAGALSVAVVVGGLAAKPVDTIRLLREIGPMGAAIAVVLLLVALVVARVRRS